MPCLPNSEGWARLLQAQPRLHGILGYYTLMNSSLLCINKLVIHNLHAPVFILLCQLAFAAAAVQLAILSGYVPREPIKREQLLKFVPLVLGFMGTLFSNMKVLQVSALSPASPPAAA